LGLNTQDKSQVFTVCAYSEYQEYKLIWWHWGFPNDLYGLDGQLLYEGKKLITQSIGGTIFPPQQVMDADTENLSRLSELRNKSPWDRFDSSVGGHGVSSSVANALMSKRLYRRLTSNYL
jgi:hypothetical protein